MENKNKIYETISFAIFLVFIGTLLLLGNLGIISFSAIFFLFFRFWPLFIILLGVKIVVGALPWGKLINLFLDVLVNVAIITALIYFNGRTDTLFNSGVKLEDIKDMNISQDFAKDVTAREYTFQVGGAEFALKDGGSLPLEVKGEKIAGKPELSYKIENGKLFSRFESNTVNNVYFLGFTNNQKFNFSLGQDNHPLDLIIRLGAGRGDVTITKTDLKTIKADVGAGELIIDLRGKQLFTDADINVGAGSVVIKMDKNTNLTVNYGVGVGMLSIKNNEKRINQNFGGLGSKGVYHVNEEISSSKSTFNVSVGAGSVEIEME